MKIKKGDEVVVIAGKDRGKTGKVLAAIPTENKVIVEGINRVTKHTPVSANARGACTIEIDTRASTATTDTKSPLIMSSTSNWIEIALQYTYLPTPVN